MRRLSVVIVFVVIQALLVAVQWAFVPPDSPLNFVCLAVSAVVLPISFGWRLGKLGTPVLWSTASGALLTLAWIGTGSIAHWASGEPDSEMWRQVVWLAFTWLLLLQLAFAYVGGNRGLRKSVNAA